MAFFDLRFILQQWEAVGVFDILLPVILIFTIIFAIFQRSGIFGRRKGIDAIVSMVIAFFAIMNPAVSLFMRNIFENTVLAIILLLAGLLILGFVMEKKPGWWKQMAGIIGLAFFIWIASRAADFYEMYYGTPTFLSSTWFANNIAWIAGVFFIIIFAIIVITSGGEKKGHGKSVGEEIIKSLFKEEKWGAED